MPQWRRGSGLVDNGIARATHAPAKNQWRICAGTTTLQATGPILILRGARTVA